MSSIAACVSASILSHVGLADVACARSSISAGRIAAFEIGLIAVEDRRRDRDVTERGKAVADRADVMIDAENFLDDDHAALRRAGRIGAIGAELESVRSGECECGSPKQPPWLPAGPRLLRACMKAETDYSCRREERYAISGLTRCDFGACGVLRPNSLRHQLIGVLSRGVIVDHRGDHHLVGLASLRPAASASRCTVVGAPTNSRARLCAMRSRSIGVYG